MWAETLVTNSESHMISDPEFIAYSGKTQYQIISPIFLANKFIISKHYQMQNNCKTTKISGLSDSSLINC